MWPTGQTQVNRLQARVRSDAKASTDSNTVRSLARRFLEHADLRPSGLPPQAVLVVRRLRDPMPGRCVTDGPTARIHPDWEAAVRQRLSTLIETAARPDRGWIDGDPEAIVFADPSELFACLALALTGSEKDHWWCLALLKSLRISANGLAALLTANSRELPAVLTCLGEWRRIDSVIEALGEHEVRTVLQQLLRIHGLSPGFLSRDTAAPLEIGMDRRQFLRGERRRLRTGRPHLGMAGPWPARVRAIVARAGPLTKVAEALLGIGLSLHAEPSIPRTRGFTEALEQWWNDGPSDALTDSDDETSLKPQAHRAFGEESIRIHRVHPPRSPAAPSRLANPANPAKPVSKETHTAGEESPAPRSTDPAPPVRASGTSRLDPAFIPTPEQAGTRADADASPVLPPPSAVGATDATDGPSHSPPPRVEEPGMVPHPTAWANATTEVTTGWGGVFYLINLMSHLDLPDCFESACQLGSTVGAWGTLELLARGLCGRDGQEHDPIWELLASLDGRESNTLPGTLFPSITAFQLPTAWIQSRLEPWPSCQWTEQSGRLIIESSGGFVVADIPRNGDGPDEQAAQEWAGIMADVGDSGATGGLEPPRLQPGGAFQPPAPLDAAVLPGLNRHLRQWMDWVLPFIRFRLAGALGDETLCNLRQALFKRAARIYVTRAHIDVVLALQGICLPVRRAGLDRDPGWCPTFGRVVQFHFE